MSKGINEFDEMVEGSKAPAAAVKMKWSMKLVGLAITAVGVLLLKSSSYPVMKQISAGVIVVGALMILGTGGIKFVLNQIWSAVKKTPIVKG